MASRTSILETIPKVVSNPPKIKPKLTISSFEKVFFDIRGAASEHPVLSIMAVIGLAVGVLVLTRKRRRSRGGFFRLDDEKNLGLLGGNINGAKKD
jgi:protein disulfide-isomerase